MPAGERRRTYMYVKYTYVTRTASIEVIFSTAARALVPAGVSPHGSPLIDQPPIGQRYCL